jgi:hypothetical protein
MADDQTNAAPPAHPWCQVRGPENNAPRRLIGFDELLAEGVDVHIERMGDGSYWIALRKDGQDQRVQFWTRGKLCSGTEMD